MSETNIRDVLLAASAYLSKLGSNLSIRSEAFREKRVCRSKLRTAQEVQKAANKLLLICSLSKKSLENVELGVHNVLNNLDAALDIDNTAESSSTHKKTTGKYYTFEIETHVLRIKTKICLKQFTAAKVVASKMSLDELLRYPVYYQCALLKNRSDIKLQQSDNTVFEKTSGSCVSKRACKYKNSKTKEKTDVIDHCLQQDTSAAPKEIVLEAGSSVLVDDAHLANKDTNDVESTKIVDKFSSCEKDVRSLEISESVVSSDTQNLVKDASHAERPLIKCVDLNKLLASNVTQHNITKAQEKKFEQKLEVESSTTNNRDSNIKSKGDLENCNKKQLDVLNFIPREFSIKIIRLPATVLAKYLQTEKSHIRKKLSELQFENTQVSEDQNGKEDIDKINLPIKNTKAKDGSNLESTEMPVEGSTHDSVGAKKQLLNYSSNSDVEDINKIKNDLLNNNTSSDEDLIPRGKASSAKRKKIMSSSSSSSDGGPFNENSRKGAGSKWRHGQDKLKRMCKMGRSRKKPDDNDNQSSEKPDSDVDIDRLTNIKNMNKRRAQASSKTTEKNKQKKVRGANPVEFEEKALLELAASSSSDEAPGDVDAGEEADLPPVNVNGGSTLKELAKDDLLAESDASSSHVTTDKEKTPDIIKKEESADESSIKKKRRKGVAISSDSEGGSSRKKDHDVRCSDFEDSDDENSLNAKKSKRKKDVDSDASLDSSDGKNKKKRRRIKNIDDSEASGSESENEGKKHGRKNIRKVMGKNQLEEATKKAAREEKERVARIAERQKFYNNLSFDESGKPDEVVLEKVILDFDPDTKEPLIQVDKGLVKKLKPHQANGIKFMWDACFESVKRIKKDRGSGCILAHCMGLGKTLQVVTLTHTLLTHSDMTGVNRVLIVCPLSTVLNWVNEFNMWLDHANCDREVVVYELSRHKQNLERAMQLQQWLVGGGVCVLGYEMFRNLSADNNKKFRKKMLRTFQEALVDPGPDLVVCDEGHLLKNEKTSLSQSMNRVKTRRRIVLTGTPLQNNLKEYYCMVQFVKPNLLGKYNEYLNRFVNPITNGQYTDSTEHDIRIMKRRSHVLHKMLDGAVQRRDYGVLAPFLPPKHEYVLFITLTDVQVKLYQHYLDNYSRRPMAGKSGFLFPDFQSLQRIWTHPLVLKYNSERYEIMQQKKREREEEEDSEGSLVDFIDDESTAEETSTDESVDDLSDASDDSRKKNKKKKSPKKNKNREPKVASRRGTRANPTEHDEVIELDEVKNENPTEWWIKLVEEPELEDLRNSHKLVLLFDILRQCDIIGDKVLLFSQSLYSLDLIEHFLGKIDEATQEGRIDEKLGNHVGSWAPGIDYFRLDGSTSCENRSIWCKNFNREDNPRARLFLISTRAGGLGINLVAANRVVIFDVSWNPSHDVQSIFRVYRFGQKKPCYIYRFLAMGTMEEKIYERQVTKQAISKRVIDEQQIDRHYAENDLAELYKFEPTPPEPRPIPPLPKDRLFAEMLKEHETIIYKYHEHDSLLENKEEETLTEEERKAAWEDFENEKNRPPPAPFANVWPMHNAGLMAQQQQQLAYAALANVLRKITPNMSEAQIRDMLPLIYNSNPAIMQKMNEIYMQPNMVNHQLMNSIRNSGGISVGGGVGAGMAGSSGLLYEPPWQRQHQLMQQNQMNPKYYVGGLGSRDPVEMMLQNQFSRSLGEASRGRPRGRPPSAPRPPPSAPPAPAPGDVVNLDSD